MLQSRSSMFFMILGFNESKESLSYVKGPLGQFVTRKKKYFFYSRKSILSPRTKSILLEKVSLGKAYATH